ncbi:type II toxin-antitoxin system death-on-curing family toxin [bacterium]|nr:type II toxin-antitoxin system death-on-curing family toxin [bacterium]MCI0603617.1 type II toxin-antitoxin system death-on-curing family toxin [bacterium]
MKTPVFLTLADAVEIHSNQIQIYGGVHGMRDIRLLESALAQPEGSFGGAWLHSDIYEMASAYTYHICMNHPFLDGNKRTALVAGLVFLELNGISLRDPKGILLDAMLEMASGSMSKRQFAEILRQLPVD